MDYCERKEVQRTRINVNKRKSTKKGNGKEERIEGNMLSLNFHCNTVWKYEMTQEDLDGDYYHLSFLFISYGYQWNCAIVMKKETIYG